MTAAKQPMKQVIVLRTDINMSTGKAVAQGAHASIGAYDDADSIGGPELTNAWLFSGQTKVCLRIIGERELINLKHLAMAAELPHYLVVDEGRTELPPNTPTALAIGPAPVELIDKITGSLKLY